MILFDKKGETPLDDISGLKIKNITTRTELDVVEAVDSGDYEKLKHFMFSN